MWRELKIASKENKEYNYINTFEINYWMISLLCFLFDVAECTKLCIFWTLFSLNEIPFPHLDNLFWRKKTEILTKLIKHVD